MKVVIFSVASSNPAKWRSAIIDGKKTAYITCPDCGLEGSLEDHEIAEDGRVTPSLDCPGEKCNFHEMGRLENWKP